jgi:lipopolysaccharide biosynthesis protein
MTSNPDLEAIAFYLPQYHPIPENDEWWGKGFTEWTNVAKAQPLFSGHYQPHIPADLGFYDLRLPEVRQAQADLARAHGISGFCYYHYWFTGQRLLERPFNEVLASGKPDFPFCLCWANETWSRRWLGEEKDILKQQSYSPTDDLAHVRALLPAFADDRYIKIKGRPLFLVYRPLDLPDPMKTVEIFKNECIKAGLPEPYLMGVDSHCPGFNFQEIGFDSTLFFQPKLGAVPDFMNDNRTIAKLARNIKLGITSSILKVYDSVESRQLMLGQLTKAAQLGFPSHPCVFVSWDNTPRRGKNAIVLVNSSPEIFETALAEVVSSLTKKPQDERLVFINAWNEWAEGNHLEPDLKYGTRYLEAVQRVLLKPSQDVVKC